MSRSRNYSEAFTKFSSRIDWFLKVHKVQIKGVIVWNLTLNTENVRKVYWWKLWTFISSVMRGKFFHHKLENVHVMEKYNHYYLLQSNKLVNYLMTATSSKNYDKLMNRWRHLIRKNSTWKIVLPWFWSTKTVPRNVKPTNTNLQCSMMSHDEWSFSSFFATFRLPFKAVT